MVVRAGRRLLACRLRTYLHKLSWPIWYHLSWLLVSSSHYKRASSVALGYLHQRGLLWVHLRLSYGVLGSGGRSLLGHDLLGLRIQVRCGGLGLGLAGSHQVASHRRLVGHLG